MSVYAAIFWLLAAIALFTPDSVALYLFISTAAFGALNVLPDGIGGANLLPQSAAAVIFVIRMAMNGGVRRNALLASKDRQGFALLLGFVAYACLTAVTLPSLFKGKIDIFPLDTDLLSKLEPTGANFNQCAYLLANAAAAVALFAYLKREPVAGRRERLLYALFVSGIIFIVSGLLDYSTVAPEIVKGFKTATYKLFNDTEVAHVRRITGFFSEAAAYGAPCLQIGALLFFVRGAFSSAVMRSWICPVVSCVLIAMAALSTSSTAILGVFVFAICVAWRTTSRLLQGRPIEDVRVELIIGGFLAGLFTLVAVVDSELLATPFAVLDSMVVRKATTFSFYHRALWNHFASEAVKQSLGMGVGAGSARASDWALAVLSNVGLPGFALIAWFFWLLFSQPLSERGGRSVVVAEGARYTLVVFLATEIVSGTTIDPGLMLAILSAMVLSGTRWADALSPRKRRSASKKRSRKRRTRSEKPLASPA